jgi:hypothetical protein
MDARGVVTGTAYLARVERRDSNACGLGVVMPPRIPW